MELKICHLYPDVLNLYGDRGNILCMEKRLQWRGIDVVTTGVGMAEAIKVLKKGGAAEVVPVCVAVTVKKHQGAAFPKFS